MLELGTLFHADPRSWQRGGEAGAVAASCFGQSGQDLIAGVVETVELNGGPGCAVDGRRLGTASWMSLNGLRTSVAPG